MGTYRTLFAVFSTLSLLTLVWTGAREAFPEWKHFQSEYYDQLEEKLGAQGQKDFNRPALEIQQIWAPDIGRVDRCTTCHMGVENREFFADAPQPYRAHPGKYLEWHPTNKFGCTTCHKGDGLSTDFTFAAHTPPDLFVERWKRLIEWKTKGELDDPQGLYQKALEAVNVEEIQQKVEEAEKKLERWEDEYGYHELHYFHDYMLPKEYLESTCMKCHDSRAIESVAPTIAKARDLIQNKFKCRSCHVIPQIPETSVKTAGVACPDLLGFANKNAHNLDWGNIDATHPINGFPHTGAEKDVLRGIHHDPHVWTVEHFLNPQLFIMTSEMAIDPPTYPEADTLTAFVRGLFGALPARSYVAKMPAVPPASIQPGIPSLFVAPPEAVASAPGAAQPAPAEPGTGAAAPVVPEGQVEDVTGDPTPMLPPGPTPALLPEQLGTPGAAAGQPDATSAEAAAATPAADPALEVSAPDAAAPPAEPAATPPS